MQFPRPTTIRALKRLVVSAALVVAGSAYGQTGKPVEPTSADRCAGVMERINEAQATAPSRYIKTLMTADDRCLGAMERSDKARMITRAEYVKTFRHQPDCSLNVYSYMCE